MPFTSRIFSHTYSSLKLSFKMTPLRILLSLCCVFALIFSTVICDDEMGDDGSISFSNDQGELATTLPPDHEDCDGLRQRVDEMNGTCQVFNSSQFENKKNISSKLIYEVINSIECSFCELKKNDLFSTAYDNCAKTEADKKRPYANTILCGMETLTCAFEILCDKCPNYFKEMNVTCKKESKM